jgi:outer membrane protein
MRKLVLSLCILACTTGFAQPELSLSAAIEKALINNYQVRLVQSNYEIAQVQNSWGMAGMIPTFSFNIVNSNQVMDNTNNPASFFPGVVLYDNVQFTVDMAWTVFSGFGIRINKERFDQLQEQTKGNAVVVIESTIYDIIIFYYTAISQERKMEILREMLTYSKTKLDYFRMKNEMGLNKSIDLIAFENQVLIDSSNLLMQELAVRNAKRNLNLEMGEPIENEYLLTEKIEFEVPKSTFGELSEYMLANNQNLKNQYINMELSRLNTESKKSAYYPVVSLNLGATPSVGRVELFGDTPFTTGTSSMSYYGNISARYTLFNGYQREKNVQIAEIQEEMATLQAEDLTLTLTHNLRTIFELYQTQAKIKDMSFERVEFSKAIWNYYRDRYDSGNGNILEVNDARVIYEQAVLNYYDRVFDLLKTHYDLLRITGTIAQEYKVAEQLNEGDE